jgi:purine nucleosidase
VAIPLLMDVDTGIDDALAIVLAVRSPELELVGVGTVDGNVDPQLGARNSLHVLEVVGAAHVPVAVGAEGPLTAPPRDARQVHGEDGLGDAGRPAPAGAPSGESAVDQLLRLSEEYAGELTIVAAAPLTNLALALRADPSLAERVERLVIMGGSARRGGNIGPWTEANIGHDPEAASEVFAADLPRTLVGLDVTLQVGVDEHDVAALAASSDPAARLAAAILPHYLDGYEARTGERRCAMHDPLAVAVAARPELVVTRRLPVEVETEGRRTRGMTVVDQRPGAGRSADVPQTAVALEVDVEGFEQLFLDRLMARG